MKQEIIIPNAEDIEALRVHYAALDKELQELPTKIRALESQLKAMGSRKSELESTQYSYGLVQRAHDDLTHAQRKAQDSRLPVLDEGYNGQPRIIRSLTEKWIVIAYFGQPDERRYHVHNGWLERTRSGYDKIDATRAIQLWKEHKGAA